MNDVLRWLILILCGFIIFVVGVEYGKHTRTPSSPPQFNGFPTKKENGETYVQSPAWLEPSWKKVVTSTKAKIRKFRPDTLLAGVTSEVLNDDDTVMFLDNVQIAKRIQAELSGMIGWPLTP